ncbi:uncharacterized protein WCC33_008417 isoform 1-T1 [Rhinophrynus dorsalis]
MFSLQMTVMMVNLLFVKEKILKHKHKFLAFIGVLFVCGLLWCFSSEYASCSESRESLNSLLDQLYKVEKEKLITEKKFQHLERKFQQLMKIMLETMDQGLSDLELENGNHMTSIADFRSLKQCTWKI